MQINELLIKPKKPKVKKKKVLKEAFPNPSPQKPMNIEGLVLLPPFYPMSDSVYDKNHVEFCKCANHTLAKIVAEVMWNHLEDYSWYYEDKK